MHFRIYPLLQGICAGEGRENAGCARERGERGAGDRTSAGKDACLGEPPEMEGPGDLRAMTTTLGRRRREGGELRRSGKSAEAEEVGPRRARAAPPPARSAAA
jgi:hypothetical protein